MPIKLKNNTAGTSRTKNLPNVVKLKSQPADDIDVLESTLVEPTVVGGKRSTGLIVALIIFILLAIGGTIGGFFVGRGTGYSEGWNGGYGAGNADGYNAGYGEGLSKGDVSATRREATGYDKGFEDARRCAINLALGSGANIYTCYDSWYKNFIGN